VCCAKAVLSERDSLAAAVISGVGGQEGGGGRLGASDLVVGEDGLSGDGQEGGVAGTLRTKPHAVIVDR
jgi:hypothetical protein